MEQVLIQAIKDAEAFEMIRAYGVENASRFDFEENADDFYITLLTQLLDSLEELEKASGLQERETVHQSLAEVARGLIIYSESHTSTEFEGVNQTNNHLFVAAIYYICGYEAIASLLLKNYHISNYASNAARLMFYIISGGRAWNSEHRVFAEILDPFDTYLATGEEHYLDRIVGFYERKAHSLDFSSVRDFFDSTILLYVLHKFCTDNIWVDLKRYDTQTNWKEYVAYSKEEHILSFLPSQRDALEKGLLTFEQSFSLGLATSGGKSYITELLIYQELNSNAEAKILYLAPLRSLSRELKIRFRKVSKKLNFKFACKYGGNILDEGDSSLEDAQLLVSTPETFITLEGVLNEELKKYSLIICDEGQLLDDIGRGISYELLLTRLKQQEHKRFLFLSAIIPNIEDINVWLGGKETQVGKSKYRPCELRYGIARTVNGAIDVDFWNRQLDDVSYTIAEFVSVEYCRNRVKSKTGVTCLTALKSMKAGPVMIYTSTKNNNVGCVTVSSKLSDFVSNFQSLSPKHFSHKPEMLNDLKEYVTYLLGQTYPLVKYIGEGFAYHHGDLPQDIREAIENAYAVSALPLIVSTSTLAEGVNMPVKTLVLHNLLSPLNFDKPHYMPISAIKNIVGRVGRAGQQNYGVVIVPESAKGTAEVLTRKALKSEGINRMNGTLYKLVVVLREHNWQSASYEQINNLLEKEDLAGGIDLMITRNADVSDIDTINVDEICKSSLAYKLGSENDRAMLTKVFEARYSRISSLAEEDEYSVFCETGLSLSGFKQLRESFTGDDVQQFEVFNEIEQEEFMTYLVARLKELGFVDETLNVESFVQVAILFMKGATYVKIANNRKISVDEVLKMTNFLQNGFSDCVRSVTAYVVNKYAVENSFLESWADYLKYGIWTGFQYELVTKRLSDHIAVHGMSRFVNEVMQSDWADTSYLKLNMDSVLSYFYEKGFPKLTRERVERWLKREIAK